VNEVPAVHEEFGIETAVLFGNWLGGGGSKLEKVSISPFFWGVDHCVVRHIMSGLIFVVVETDRQTKNLTSD